MDCGYLNFSHWSRLKKAGAFFVTRLGSNIRLCGLSVKGRLFKELGAHAIPRVGQHEDFRPAMENAESDDYGALPG